LYYFKVLLVELVLEDKFSDEDVGANGVRDKIPGVVGDQDSKFFFHGATPVQIGDGSADSGGTGDKADTKVADRVSLSAGSVNHTSPTWSSVEG
jgi:hypothetical protein